MTVPLYLLAATLLPLLTCTVLFFFGRRMGRFAGMLATFLIAGSLALAVGGLITWVAKSALNGPVRVNEPAVETLGWNWFTPPASPTGIEPTASAAPPIRLGVLADSLSAALVLLVTFLGALAHYFALATHSPDPTTVTDDLPSTRTNSPRFFGALNLLLFATLALIVANSLIQIVICWQLMGIATWMLIHFRSDRRLAVLGSFRAFVFGRFSDAALLGAIALLIFHAGSFPDLALYDDKGTSVLTDVVAKAYGLGQSEFLTASGGFLGFHWVTWCGVLFVLAALARAAQFPFSTWIADAAQAPTPATAIIQTSTTLAAGLYLLARVYPILTLDARMILAMLAATSLILAAIIACAQTDLRHILAWTSVAQFALALLFLGAGAYAPAILLLFTHAFIKTTLLFAHGNVTNAFYRADLPLPSIDNLGGLWKRLPITAAAALLATLALAGMPFFTGAYSLSQGFESLHLYAAALSNRAGFSPTMLLFYAPLGAAFLTAFAIGRWWWLTFAAPPAAVATGSSKPFKLDDIHESASATLPLLVPTVFCIGILFEFSGIRTFIERSTPAEILAYLTAKPSTQSAAMIDPFVATVAWLIPAGALLAFLVYLRGPGLMRRVARWPLVNIVHLFAAEGFFLGAFYDAVAGLVIALANFTQIIDRYIWSPILRLTAFAAEALAHLVAHVDRWLDAPLRRYSLLLAVRIHRALAPPPEPKEN